MLKLPTQTPSKAYHVRIAHYGVEGLASDIPSLNLPIGRTASRGNRARAGIIIRLLHDLRNDFAHPSNAGEHVALEELRRHVALCILDTCLKRELASQSNEHSYFTRNLFNLAAIGRIMTDLTCNDPGEVTDPLLSFEDAVKIVAKLFANSAGKIDVAVDMPKLDLSALEFRVLMNVGFELVLNSVRHAFYKDGTGQVSVSLKVANNGQDVELCVADNGFGPERLSFGRGLRLVSRVSAVVAGDIAVRRQPSGGTGLALTFPRARIRRQRSRLSSWTGF
jgi:anti-sigma regulatory factor (Ser/Thr protein kinase)